MSDLHYKKAKKKSSGKGFYVALGICLVAIGVAAWTTYDNVAQYMTMPEEETQSSSAVQTENTVSGIKQDPESTPEPEASSSSKPGHDVDLIVSTNPSPTPPESQEPEPSSSEAGLIFTNPEEQRFVSPAGNSVLKEFSGDELVYSETMKDWRVHPGIDLAAAVGDTVHSIGNGTVKEIYTDEMYGNVIVITYGTIDVYYCGLGSTALVEVGESVTTGQDIGSVNTVPCESIEAAHLHVGFEQDGEWINPATLLP